jgi:hypothetical protein
MPRLWAIRSRWPKGGWELVHSLTPAEGGPERDGRVRDAHTYSRSERNVLSESTLGSQQDGRWLKQRKARRKTACVEVCNSIRSSPWWAWDRVMWRKPLRVDCFPRLYYNLKVEANRFYGKRPSAHAPLPTHLTRAQTDHTCRPRTPRLVDALGSRFVYDVGVMMTRADQYTTQGENNA